MDEREQFERDYALRSGVTVDFLHHWGRFAEPCDCGEDRCAGWAMGYQHEDALFMDAHEPPAPASPS